MSMSATSGEISAFWAEGPDCLRRASRREKARALSAIDDLIGRTHDRTRRNQLRRLRAELARAHDRATEELIEQSLF